MSSLSSQELLHLETEVCKILQNAGSELLQSWEKKKHVDKKAAFEPVTEFDLIIEKELHARLKDLLPHAGFILEEEESEYENEFNWAIDPIDGTAFFIGQLPLFYTQVALLYQNEPILGVIYNPVSDQLFSASKGNGAKLNGVTLSPTPHASHEEITIDLDFGGNLSDPTWKTTIFAKLVKQFRRVRISGGAFAPYITTNVIDISITINERTKIVDQMPRIILAREAGFRSEILTIKEKTIYITTPPTLFEEIKRIIENSIVSFLSGK